MTSVLVSRGRSPVRAIVDRYRLGPCPGPSTQWQLGRPQGLKVSISEPRTICSIGGRPRIRRWRRLRSAADETFCMLGGPNQGDVRVIQKVDHRSSPTFAFQRSDEFGERQQTEGVDEQWLAAASCYLRIGRGPVGPFARHGDRTELRLT